MALYHIELHYSAYTTFCGSGPLLYFFFSLFAFAFLLFVAFDVPNVVILFVSFFSHTPHYHTKSDFENTFGSSKIQKAQNRRKPY